MKRRRIPGGGLARAAAAVVLLGSTIGASQATPAASSTGSINPWDRYNWIFGSPAAMVISGGGETGLLAAQEAVTSPTEPPADSGPVPLSPAAARQVNGPDPLTTQQTTQSETSIATSGTGSSAKLVIGFNNSRICCAFPGLFRLSGFSFSVNGGATWTDGGPIPNPPGGGFAAPLGDPPVAFNPATSTLSHSTLTFHPPVCSPPPL